MSKNNIELKNVIYAVFKSYVPYDAGGKYFVYMGKSKNEIIFISTFPTK